MDDLLQSLENRLEQYDALNDEAVNDLLQEIDEKTQIMKEEIQNFERFLGSLDYNKSLISKIKIGYPSDLVERLRTNEKITKKMEREVSSANCGIRKE